MLNRFMINRAFPEIFRIPEVVLLNVFLDYNILMIYLQILKTNLQLFAIYLKNISPFLESIE